MGTSGVPMNFASAVDRLCKQIEVLFQPLTDHLRENRPDGLAPFPSLEDQFRDLHKIVTAAANLSVKIRLSSTIFYFNSELPGNTFDRKNQVNIDQPAYLASKAAVTASLGEKRKVDRQELVSTSYGPLIKFAIWPSVRRYSPGNGNSDGTYNGYRIYEICKCRVVYYWGPKHPPQEPEQYLQEFIDQRRRDNMRQVKIFAESWGQNMQDIKSRISSEILKWKSLVGLVVLAIILCVVYYGREVHP